jgi:uncharacterized membrane protein YukC
LESLTNLDQVYKEAFSEFPNKNKTPAPQNAKAARESSEQMSNYIKNNFKPEADVLLSGGTKASMFFQESKTKSKERLREYLADTVSEFVDTNVLSGDEFFEVLLEVVYDNWQFYQKNADENKVLIKLLQNVNTAD